MASSGNGLYVGLIVVSLIILLIGIILLILWAVDKKKYANLRIWGIILTSVGALAFIVTAIFAVRYNKQTSIVPSGVISSVPVGATFQSGAALNIAPSGVSYMPPSATNNAVNAAASAFS